MASERAFNETISRSLEVGRPGERLTLEGPGVELTFERAAAVDPAEFTGSTWVLESLIDGVGVNAATGDPATLTFTVGDELFGTTGCRSAVGRYTLAADTVRLTALTLSGDCPPELQGQDEDVAYVLEGGFTVEVTLDHLIAVAAGNRMLVYRIEP